MCCMAQETQTGALYQPRGVGWGGRWEGSSRGGGHIYTYGWFMLMFGRKQQNSVKQLSIKFFSLKKRKKNLKKHGHKAFLCLSPCGERPYRSQCYQWPTSQVRTLRLKGAKEITAREWLSQESRPRSTKPCPWASCPRPLLLGCPFRV